MYNYDAYLDVSELLQAAFLISMHCKTCRLRCDQPRWTRGRPLPWPIAAAGDDVQEGVAYYNVVEQGRHGACRNHNHKAAKQTRRLGASVQKILLGPGLDPTRYAHIRTSTLTYTIPELHTILRRTQRTRKRMSCGDRCRELLLHCICLLAACHLCYESPCRAVLLSFCHLCLDNTMSHCPGYYILTSSPKT